MTVVVLGATGQTGMPLVQQLLDGGHKVRIVVRSLAKIDEALLANPNLIVQESA
jgi:uncharacterized protein YbjT (DUF2867 family)